MKIKNLPISAYGNEQGQLLKLRYHSVLPFSHKKSLIGCKHTLFDITVETGRPTQPKAFSQQLAEGIHRFCITAFHQTAAL